MNKQEAIELIHKMAQESFELTKIHAVHVDSIVDVINQIDEPRKVVVPKFVAEWISYCKVSRLDLADVINRLDDEEAVGNWVYDEYDNLLPDRVDLIARAWLDGYEIEREQLYTVEIPNPNVDSTFHTCLVKNTKGKVELECQDWFNCAEQYQLTELEVKQDFEWAWEWAKPVEVE